MNAWEGLGTALIAAIVSLAVSITFRWWEARKVRWLVTGEHHDEYDSGHKNGLQRANVWLHNVGDGDAYGVITTRSNGEQYQSWDEFEAGRVPAGESVKVEMSVPPDGWETASLALSWQTSPTERGKAHNYGPILLKDALQRTRDGMRTERREREARRLRRPGDTEQTTR